jgi:hypothetical protein
MYVCLSLLNFFSLFNSVPIIHDYKKLRRFYSFACRLPGLERLLTASFHQTSYCHFCVWIKMDKKWLLIRCVKLR